MAAKTPVQPAVSTTKSAKPRKLKKPSYTSFKLQKRLVHHAPAVAGSVRILKEALRLLWRNWKLFGGIVFLYGILQIVLVQGFSQTSDVATIKASTESALGGNLGQLSTGLTSFGYLLGTTGAGGAYQALVVLVTSLALIWTIRQVYAGEKPRIRDGFYEGIAPLVQFSLVLCVIALQLLPAIAITMLFSYASTAGIVAASVEYLLWLILIIAGFLLTFYMICSSLFALYIVTLPGMTPLRALRSARELVKFRRWMVMRRIMFLPIALAVIAGLIVVPLIIFATALAGYVFIFLSLFGIAIIHSYMYRLYKELLG